MVAGWGGDVAGLYTYHGLPAFVFTLHGRQCLCVGVDAGQAFGSVCLAVFHMFLLFIVCVPRAARLKGRRDARAQASLQPAEQGVHDFRGA